MTFAQSISTCFGKYATFSGRASRSEYWWFALFIMIVNAVAHRFEGGLFASIDFSIGPASSVVSVILLIPAISVTVRRFHDLDKSGWWYWIVLIPFVGWILLIVMMATEGHAGTNIYGDAPTRDTPSKPVEPDPIVEERDSSIPEVRNTREPTIRRR